MKNYISHFRFSIQWGRNQVIFSSICNGEGIELNTSSFLIGVYLMERLIREQRTLIALLMVRAAHEMFRSGFAESVSPPITASKPRVCKNSQRPLGTSHFVPLGLIRLLYAKMSPFAFH